MASNSWRLKALSTPSIAQQPSPVKTFASQARAHSLYSACNPHSRQRMRVHWMYGPAGAGKSAIMRTLASALEDDGALLASFFFIRSDSTRNTFRPFIPTIAYQTATRIPQTRDPITSFVDQNPAIFSQPPQRQSRALVEEPLVNAFSAQPGNVPLVIILDGLDECAEADRQVELIRTVVELASLVRSRLGSTSRIKILIASRPEHRIREEFEDMLRRNPQAAVLVELDPSDANIELYYDIRINEIRTRHRLPATWPSMEQVRWLNDMTSGQYSFAHISTGFMNAGDPVVRLQIIQDAIPAHGLQPFEPLDFLYSTVFQQLPPEMLRPALLFLWLIYHKRWNRHCVPIIEYLLQLPSGYVDRLSLHLSSLIDFSKGTPRPYHASLRDFLCDPTRSTKFSLFLDPRIALETVLQALLSPALQQTDIAFEDKISISAFMVQCKGIVQEMRLSESPQELQIPFAKLEESVSALDVWTFAHLDQLLNLLADAPLNRPLNSMPSLQLQSLQATMRRVWETRMSAYDELPDQDSSVMLASVLLSTFELRTHGNRLELVALVHKMARVNKAFHVLDSTKGWSLFNDLLEPLLCVSPEYKAQNSFAFLHFGMTIGQGIFHDASANASFLSHLLSALLENPLKSTRGPLANFFFITCGNAEGSSSECEDCISNLDDFVFLIVHTISQAMPEELIVLSYEGYRLLLQLARTNHRSWNSCPLMRRIHQSIQSRFIRVQEETMVVRMGSEGEPKELVIEHTINQVTEMVDVARAVENRVDELEEDGIQYLFSGVDGAGVLTLSRQR